MSEETVRPLCIFIRVGRTPCKHLAASSESPFCSLHRPLEGDRRICHECKHSVLTNKWERHENVCKGIKESLDVPSYFAQGMNTVFTAGPLLPPPDRAVAPPLELRIAALYNAHIGTIPEQYLDDTPLSASWKDISLLQRGMTADPSNATFLKHRMQEASIIGHIDHHALLSPHSAHNHKEFVAEFEGGCRPCTVVDFGSGRGGLSKCVSSHFPSAQLQFLCIERQTYQHKAEKSIRAKTNQRVHRSKIDVAHVDLHQLFARLEADRVLTRTNHTVGIGKHLCGPATDFALNALRKWKEKSIADGEDGSVAVCIATCCHSTIDTMTATAALEWLSECGITAEDFQMMKKWSGSVSHAEPRASIDNVSDPAAILEPLGAVEGSVLGRMCKRLIDHGRCEWIKRYLGLDARLLHYVPTAVSPENCLLVAY